MNSYAAEKIIEQQERERHEYLSRVRLYARTRVPRRSILQIAASFLSVRKERKPARTESCCSCC